MPSTRPPYPAVFRQQMVELVRSGRTPGELTREFEPSAQAIRNWVAQAEPDAGERSNGLRTEEREKLRRRLLAARAVPFPRLLALRDVLPDPGQTRANKAASAL